MTEGHPDKICDQVSDAVLDALLAQDPASRVACETVVNTGLCLITGEVTTTAKVDYIGLVRGVIEKIGYSGARAGGFDANSCAVLVHQNGAAVGIEATGAGTGVADLLDHTAHQTDVIDLGGRRHFAGDQAKTRVDDGLASHPRGGVLGQQGVQHRIAHLVADLVGMTFGHRLRGEDASSPRSR